MKFLSIDKNKYAAYNKKVCTTALQKGAYILYEIDIQTTSS